MAGGHRDGVRQRDRQRSHVGQLVHSEMVQRGLSVRELAALSDLSTRDLVDLFGGALLRLSVARGLGRGLGVGMTFILQLDAELRGPHGCGPTVKREPVPAGPRDHLTGRKVSDRR